MLFTSPLRRWRKELGVNEDNNIFILETRNSRGDWCNPIVSPFKVVVDTSTVSVKIEQVMRSGGQDRYETSKLIAENNFGDNLENVVLASGNDFPDGLAGVTLAKKLNAPLLLFDKSVESSGSKVVLQYILNKLNKNGKIYIFVSQSSYISGAKSINDVTGSNKVSINVFGGNKIITNYLISRINNI